MLTMLGLSLLFLHDVADKEPGFVIESVKFSFHFLGFCCACMRY